MEIVISHKHFLVKPNTQTSELARLATAPGVTIKHIFDPAETEKYIARQTAQGHVCHRFRYLDSHRSAHSVESYSATAA